MREVKLLPKGLSDNSCNMIFTDSDIRLQEESFKLYLKYVLQEEELWKILNFLAEHNKVYVFSGVIRDFLTGMTCPVRDVDLVVKKTAHLDLLLRNLRNIEVRRNSFGGFKLKYKHLTFDIWGISDTWNIKLHNLNPNPYILINTVFFNFSAIVFDFQKEKFIYNQKFLKFLNTYEMDVVNELNPNNALCIINTLYYHHKYGFSIGKNLSKWIRKHFDTHMDFEGVQKSHFGKILYSKSDIEKFQKSL